MSEIITLIKIEIKAKKKINIKKITTDTSIKNNTKIMNVMTNLSKVIVLITKKIEITIINKIKDKISKISLN
jgi:hypothetical protein